MPVEAQTYYFVVVYTRQGKRWRAEFDIPAPAGVLTEAMKRAAVRRWDSTWFYGVHPGDVIHTRTFGIEQDGKYTPLEVVSAGQYSQ